MKWREDGCDHLCKVRPILPQFNTKNQEPYKSGKHISIDVLLQDSLLFEFKMLQEAQKIAYVDRWKCYSSSLEAVTNQEECICSKEIHGVSEVMTQLEEPSVPREMFGSYCSFFCCSCLVALKFSLKLRSLVLWGHKSSVYLQTKKDSGVLLNKNQIKAVRHTIFKVVENALTLKQPQKVKETQVQLRHVLT